MSLREMLSMTPNPCFGKSCKNPVQSRSRRPFPRKNPYFSSSGAAEMSLEWCCRITISRITLLSRRKTARLPHSSTLTRKKPLAPSQHHDRPHSKYPRNPLDKEHQEPCL